MFQGFDAEMLCLPSFDSEIVMLAGFNEKMRGSHYIQPPSPALPPPFAVFVRPVFMFMHFHHQRTIRRCCKQVAPTLL